MAAGLGTIRMPGGSWGNMYGWLSCENRVLRYRVAINEHRNYRICGIAFSVKLYKIQLRHYERAYVCFILRGALPYYGIYIYAFHAHDVNLRRVTLTLQARYCSAVRGQLAVVDIQANRLH